MARTSAFKSNTHRNSKKPEGGYKHERKSKDGRKQTTKGGKGGKVQLDGSDHRGMGSLDEEYMTPTSVNKLDFAAKRVEEEEFDYDTTDSSSGSV